MKLKREEAKKQLKRLAANPAMFPQSEDGQKELLNCLMRHCTSEAHAQATMTRVLDTCTDPRNLTAEITLAASATREGEVLPSGCPKCDRGLDPETGVQMWAAHVQTERNGYDVAVRCDCPRGQWLARRDKERKVPETRKAAGMERPSSDWAKKAAGESE